MINVHRRRLPVRAESRNLSERDLLSKIPVENFGQLNIRYDNGRCRFALSLGKTAEFCAPSLRTVAVKEGVFSTRQCNTQSFAPMIAISSFASKTQHNADQRLTTSAEKTARANPLDREVYSISPRARKSSRAKLTRTPSPLTPNAYSTTMPLCGRYQHALAWKPAAHFVRACAVRIRGTPQSSRRR